MIGAVDVHTLCSNCRRTGREAGLFTADCVRWAAIVARWSLIKRGNWREIDDRKLDRGRAGHGEWNND